MTDVAAKHSGTPSSAGPAWLRLQEQIGWYDAQSKQASRWYKTVKVLQIVIAAAIPVVASVNVSGWVTGGLGSTIVVLEGLQQLNRFHEYWLSYRATCEALRQEMFLFESSAGNYRAENECDAVLAERMKEIISQEASRWASLHTADKGERSS